MKMIREVVDRLTVEFDGEVSQETVANVVEETVAKWKDRPIG